MISRLQSYHDPESKSDDARAARLDPIKFGERYVKPHEARWTGDTQQFQRDMVYHFIEGSRFDPEILKTVSRPRDAIELSETAFRMAWVPVEHAKTTWLSLVLPLWMLALDQEAMICLIGNRQEDAMKPMAVIKWHIENNQLLRADFPELRPDDNAGWSDKRLFVARKSRSKDPSIQTSGITGTIQGARLDAVFGDDVQDRKRALSTTMNHADQENWQEIIENRVVKGGICGTYGTLQTSRDLNATMARSPGYKVLHLSAIDTAGKYGPPGKPLWMPQKRLDDARKRQGTRRFARKYLNDAKDEGGKQLKAEWLNIVGREDIPWSDLSYYAGVDPATGEAEVSNPDEYCICYGGRDSKGKIYVLGFRASSDWGLFEGTRELATLHRKKKFVKVAVEAVSFQVAAKQHIWQTTNVPAYKSTTVKSKEIRFESMAALFDMDRVMIYEDGPGVLSHDGDGKDEGENFYDQWIDFPEGVHDDRLDACEKMIEAAMGGRRKSAKRSGKIRDALAGAKFT